MGVSSKWIVTLLAIFVLVIEIRAEHKWKTLKSLFTDIYSVGGAVFHPFKPEIVYVSGESGTFQLYQVKFKGHKLSKPKQLTNFKNRVSDPRYLPDGSIMFYHDKGGNENFQIGILKPDGKYQFITEDTETKHILNSVTPYYIYFTSNKRDKKKFDILRRKMPLTEKSEAELIYTPKKGMASASHISPDETNLLITQHYSNLDNEVFLYDMVNEKKTPLTRPMDGGSGTRWYPVRFMDNSRTKLMVRTDFKSDYLRLAFLHWPDGDYTKKAKFETIAKMESLKTDILAMSSSRGRTYIELRKNEVSHLYSCKINAEGDVLDWKPFPIPLKKPILLHGGTRSYGSPISFSNDGKMMMLTMNNYQTPANIYGVSVKNPKKFFKLVHRKVSKQLGKIHFQPTHNYHAKSFDGLQIPYFMALPTQAKQKKVKKKVPLIVNLHGGPEAQSLQQFSPLQQYFLQLGFAVAVPNIRGSSGYGRKYLDLDNREKRMDAIADVKYVVQDAIKHASIDGDRVVVLGGSYGGLASLLSAVTYPKVFRGSVDIVGISNLITFFKHTAEWRRDLRAMEYGDYKTQKDLLRRISPINHVQNIRCPVFMISGANDERVPASEAKQMYKKIMQVAKSHPKRKALLKSKLMIFKDEGHGLSKLKNRLKAWRKLGKWLKDITK